MNSPGGSAAADDNSLHFTGASPTRYGGCSRLYFPRLDEPATPALLVNFVVIASGRRQSSSSCPDVLRERLGYQYRTADQQS